MDTSLEKEHYNYSGYTKLKRIKQKRMILALPNYTFWNILMMVFVTIDFYLTTLCLSLLEAYTMDFVPFFIISDSIYIFNLAVLFLHRFWKKLSTKLSQTVKTSSLILIVDVASILPQVTLLLIYFRPDYKNVILYCRLAICLRLHRLIFFRKVQQELLQLRWMWFLIENMFYLLIILHVTNTAWLLITRQNSFCTEMESWHRSESHVSLHNLKSLESWYFLVTYLSIQTLFNVGFGDINPFNICEMFWFIVAMIIGQFFSITFIAMACWLMINRTFHGIVCSQMVSYVGKYVENLTNPTKNHVQNYYKYQWENYCGIRDAPLLNTLPFTIQMDVAFDINRRLLSRSLLLKDLPIYIQRKIALAMKTILLVPGQSIYDKGVTKQYMVWVKQGLLQTIYDGRHCSTIFFTEGAVLGEASLFLNLSSKTTVRAAKYSELEILDKASFLKIMLHHIKELKKKRNMIAQRIDTIVQESSEPIASQNLRTLVTKRLEIGDSNIGNYSEYLSLYKLSKNVKLTEVQAGIFKIVTENVVLMKIWSFLLATIQTIYCLWYPYYAVFERYIPYDLYVFGIAADTVYFLDVLLQFVTAVKLKNKIAAKLMEIIDIKLAYWTFYCDVFSLFPIEVWAYIIERPTDRERIYDLLRLNRLLRIWRIRYLFELLENGNNYIVAILKYTTYSVIFTYFISCLLYLNACPNLICQEESWYHQKIIKDLQMSKDIEYGEFTLPKSLYFAVMSVCHTGLGDVLPKSGSDIVIVAFIILISVTLKTYCMSQIMSFMFLKDFCAKTYELLFYLKASLNHFQLPKQIKRRLTRYVTSTRYFPEKHVSRFIKNSISDLLQDEIELSKLQNSLSNLPFLKMADPYFIAMLEKEAKVLFLPENEILYNFGDRTRNMYVLQQGYCNLYTADQLEQTVGPGTQIGVIEMFSGNCKGHTVIAVTDCFIVFLEYRSFSNILQLFPTEYHVLKDVLQSQWFLRMAKRAEHKTNKVNFGVFHRKLQTKALIRTSWKKLWETYRLKLGVFRVLGFLLAPFTIHPECMFMKVWCTIRCLLIIAFGLVLPLITMLPPFVDSLYWLIFICQCSLFIDMYILLHTAYYNDTGQLETRPLYTAWHYITHSFALDLLAALPVAQISLVFDPSSSKHYNDVIHVLAPHYRHCKWRLLGLVQLHRVFSYLSYLKTVCWKSHIPIEVIKIIGMVALLINVLASLMLSVTCGYEFDQTYATNKHSKAFYDSVDNATYYGVAICQNGFWLNNSMFSKISEPSGLYLVATYSVVNFMTHTGLGDITGQTWLPMIGAVVTIFIGFALFLFICALVVTKMLQKDAAGMNFRKKVEQLEPFLKNNSVPIDLRKKVDDHLKFIWQRTNGLNYSTIIRDFEFNSTLTDDVILTQYHSCLKYCALFKNLDISSLRLIVKYMKTCHYKKGDVITDCKEVIGNIFIVASGEVQIFNKNHYCLDTLGIGAAFGNIHQSIHSCSRIYVKARKNVELCVIATEELLDIIKSYPNVFHRIKEMLTQGLEYIEPYNLPASEEGDKRLDFWDEMESDDDDDDLPPKRKSSLSLINSLVVLKPHHFIFKAIAFLTVIASCVNAVFIPYVFVTQDRHYICFLYLIFEPIFYVRIYMKLRQAYYNVYGNFVKSKRKIIQRYFNIPVQVLWDAISNFPLALACFVREERFFLYTCLRMLHLLRIYYILEYFKVQEQKFKLKIWLPILKLGLIYVILIHLFSCFWLMMACPFDHCHSETWISQSKYMMNKPPIFKILLSYYYVISTVTTTGVGDILPQNIYDMIVTSVFMLVGKLMIIIFIGTILRFMYFSNFDLVRFEYKVTLLRKYLQNQNISDYQLRKIWLYMQNLWKYGRGNNFPKLLHELPYFLTCDIMMCLYGHHLHQNVLFKNTDEVLLRQICSKFQRQLFFHRDCIIKSGDINSSMHFVQSGNVSVLTEHGDLSETEHVVLQPNDMFGISQGFGEDTPHHFTYRAASDLVEVLTLPFQSWAFLLPYFSKDKAVIFARMQKESGKV